MTSFKKELEEIDLVTDLLLGGFLGVIHTVTLWLTTDYGTMMESLMLWGDEYTWMYISVGIVDGIIILGVVSATRWGRRS